MPRRMTRQRKRRSGARQLALTETGQKVPRWTTLPEETRREVVEFLVRLVQSDDTVNGEEGDDE